MKAKGFTIIEIMFIVAIITLLAVIFAPIFKGAKTCNDSNDMYCLSNVITTSDGLKIACVNGIVYFLSERSIPSTPVIDPQTKEPKNCQVENL